MMSFIFFIAVKGTEQITTTIKPGSKPGPSLLLDRSLNSSLLFNDTLDNSLPSTASNDKSTRTETTADITQKANADPQRTKTEETESSVDNVGQSTAYQKQEFTTVSLTRPHQGLFSLSFIQLSCLQVVRSQVWRAWNQLVV